MMRMICHFIILQCWNAVPLCVCVSQILITMWKECVAESMLYHPVLYFVTQLVLNLKPNETYFGTLDIWRYPYLHQGNFSLCFRQTKHIWIMYTWEWYSWDILSHHQDGHQTDNSLNENDMTPKGQVSF